MKYVLIALALAAMCVPASAAGNPDVNVYVSFDQSGAGGLVHTYTMTQYVGFKAYFCFGELDMGLVVVSFMINDPQTEYPGLFASQSFTNLLDLMAGDPFTGMSLASTTCRPGPIVVVGYLELFPTAVGPCCVNILDDPDFPRWVVDCTLPNGEVDYYVFLSNGSINGADCPDTPVEASTWGSIKALYR
jgi:hypothetical protein